MLDKILFEILKVSPFFAAVMYYVWRLHSDLRKVETKRVEDLTTLLEKLLKQAGDDNRMAERQARAIERMHEVVQDLTEETKLALHQLDSDRPLAVFCV